jgi:hypothetical protein
MAIFKPRDFNIRPIAAAVTPFPTELTTPPVQKLYFGVGNVDFSHDHVGL